MQLKHYEKVQKPWGGFERLTWNEQTTVKLITVNPKSRLSYQSHKQRSEYWRCIKGSFMALLDGREVVLKENEDVFVPAGMKHRMVGLEGPAVCLEISFGNFDENDIVRYEDDYGRV